MKINQISSFIDYVQPDETPFASTSSSIFIKSSPSIVIDLNLGNEDTDQYNPDIALLSHYHLDHSLCAPIADNHEKTELWIPEGEINYLTSQDHFIENTCGPYEVSEQFRNIVQHFLKFPEVKNYKTFGDNETFKCKSNNLS